jgi:hypothetical protein
MGHPKDNGCIINFYQILEEEKYDHGSGYHP